jgi:Ca2+-binding EF-hand superfamily protein
MVDGQRAWKTDSRSRERAMVMSQGCKPLATLVAFLLLAFPAIADSPKPASDAYYLLYLAPARPYWLRLHIRCDGKPVADLWESALDKLFANLDVNGDGFLDAFECRRVPHSVALNQVIQSGYPLLRSFNSPELKELDTNGDGKLSRAELGEYYRKANPPLVRVQPQFNPDPYADNITRTIFNLLDSDRSGRLTQAKLQQAEKLLERFDADDDECLTVLELIPDLQVSRFTPQPAKNPTALLFFPAHAPPKDLAQKLLAIYDRDNDYQLSRKEIALDDAAFAALDRDGNGQLDVPELADFFAHGLPDLEVELNLDSAPGRVSKMISRRESLPLRDSSPGRIVVMADRQLLSVGESSAPMLNRRGGATRDSYRQGFTQLFLQAAAGKSFVEEKDLSGPSVQTLKPYLALADRDGDGKLTMQEFTAFLELQFQFIDTPLSVAFFNLTPNWFVDLDTNRDGRLSRRELRDAWKTLSAKYPVVNGALERPNAKEEWNIAFSRGPMVPIPALSYISPPPPPVPTRGPLWFRKMDRNRDGFVSRREFLGTREEFDRIDTDGDGLIDPEEAEKATQMATGRR